MKMQNYFGDICAGIIVLTVVCLAVVRPYGTENVELNEDQVIEQSIQQSKVLDAYGELFIKNQAK